MEEGIFFCLCMRKCWLEKRNLNKKEEDEEEEEEEKEPVKQKTAKQKDRNRKGVRVNHKDEVTHSSPHGCFA